MSGPGKAVFLSYASQDAEAARRICEALRGAGVEVWFDRSELRGGDAWDQKIRRQIKECALFVPVISANTNARAEGYFRLEWKLAVDRSHLMADDAPFLFPVVIDDTSDAAARVPDKFREVQWSRLRLDETPAELAGRVAKLLAAPVGAPLAGAQGRRPATLLQKEKTGFGKWWWLIFPIMGMSIPIIDALKQEDPPARPTNAAPVAATPAAPVASEARQLAERARAMTFRKFNSTADDYAAAEGLLRRALELEPNDAEIWAMSSQFHTAIRTRGFDPAPERRELARSHAERALKLDPDSVEGRYALGRWQRDDVADPTVAEQSFRAVLASRPDHPGAMMSLAVLLGRMGRFEECMELYERSVRQGEFRALARYQQYLACMGRGRFADAERYVRDSISLDPSANAVAGLAMERLTAHSDTAGAVEALQLAPEANRNEHRMVWTSAFTLLCAAKPDDALRELGRLSADFISDNWFQGPKAYWVGRAHRQAGRVEGARVAFESGLALVDRRLADSPDNRRLRLIRGELLAWLGREDEALREARILVELDSSGPDFGAWFVSPVRIYAVLGRAEDCRPLLERLLAPRPDVDVGWPLTPALMRVDPLWDRVRDAPEMQQLLAKAAIPSPQ